MTMCTVKTNPKEADLILNGNKSFVFRGDAPQYVVGNNISFAVIDDKRVTKHPLEDRVYKITCIERDAPVDDGIVAIGFRRIS